MHTHYTKTSYNKNNRKKQKEKTGHKCFSWRVTRHSASWDSVDTQHTYPVHCRCTHTHTHVPPSFDVPSHCSKMKGARRALSTRSHFGLLSLGQLENQILFCLRCPPRIVIRHGHNTHALSWWVRMCNILRYQITVGVESQATWIWFLCWLE